ncbi:hypothetical protein V6615_00145 [Oscillospiraceae bacterium PP1C4]
MDLIIIIVVLYLLVVLIDFLPTVGEKAKKDKWIYVVVLACSFSILMLTNLGIEIHGPSELIKSTIEKMFSIQ